MLNIPDCILSVVDVQVKLVPAMHEKEKLLDNLSRLIRGVKVLGVPVLLTEQYPRGLGTTVTEIKSIISETEPVIKTVFSCCGSPEYMQQLNESGRRQVIVAGIETHVCVYQTAVELAKIGYNVYVAADATASRSLFNKEIALRQLTAVGVNLTTVEMALCELLKVAEGDKFKQILELIK